MPCMTVVADRTQDPRGVIEITLTGVSPLLCHQEIPSIGIVCRDTSADLPGPQTYGVIGIGCRPEGSGLPQLIGYKIIYSLKTDYIRPFDYA